MKGMIFISQSDDMSVVTSHGPSFPQFPFLVAFKQAVNPPVDVGHSKVRDSLI